MMTRFLPLVLSTPCLPCNSCCSWKRTSRLPSAMRTWNSKIFRVLTPWPSLYRERLQTADMELTVEQQRLRTTVREFADAHIVPHANTWDREERVPVEVVRQLAGKGWLGAVLPADRGGAGFNMVEFGLLNEELGRGCSSIRSLLTVHSMVALTIGRWGTEAQKAR